MATPEIERLADELREFDNVLKGDLGGECERAACKNGPARWYNSGTRKFYCQPCALRINAECGGQEICVRGGEALLLVDGNSTTLGQFIADNTAPNVWQDPEMIAAVRKLQAGEVYTYNAGAGGLWRIERPR